MKTFAICFVALCAVAAARSVIDDVVGSESNYGDGIDDRILGGQETTIEQHPYQVTVGTPRFIFDVCGGSIISPIRALTVANYMDERFPAKWYSIMAGSTSRDGGANNQTRELTRFVKHERFNEPFLSNNIAILFWAEPLTFGANVQAIQLPAANAPVPYGQNATLSGWTWVNKNTTFREVTKPLISNEACNRTLTGWIQPDMLCSEEDVDHGATYGDHGDPLVHNNSLIGIFSWNLRPRSDSDPDVYTRVAYFIDWINQNSK